MRYFPCLTALALMTACSPPPTDSNNSDATAAPEPAVVQSPREDDPVVKKALAALKSEPKIKDVMYQPDAAVKWSVGVFDDGTSSNGYAQYVCLTLKDIGIDTERVIVRVVDIVKIAQGGVPGSDTSLGSAICKNSQPFD
jgi:hypothetical protein